MQSPASTAKRDLVLPTWSNPVLVIKQATRARSSPFDGLCVVLNPGGGTGYAA